MQRKRVRFAFAALALVAVVGTFVLLSPATSAAPKGLCTYYNNAQHAQVVGQRGVDCCGSPVSWGVVTQFKYCAVEYCIWCPPIE